MGNLGGYQDITTAAKAAGGTDKLIAIIQADAAKKAAAGQRGQGAAIALGAVALLVAGKQGWDAYTARREASKARSDAAASDLKALIDAPGAAVDDSPSQPGADGRADPGDGGELGAG